MPLYRERGWRRCVKCQALSHEWFEYKPCPYPGAQLHQYATETYALSHDQVTEHAQNGWRKCPSCWQLFHSSNPGNCRGGLPHNDSSGGDYYVHHAVDRDPPVEAQPGWKYCTACSRLFYAAGGGGSCTAAQGGPHAGASSHYSVPVVPMLEAPVVVTRGTIEVSASVSNWSPEVIGTWDQVSNWATVTCYLMFDVGAPPAPHIEADDNRSQTITHDGQRFSWKFTLPGSGWGVGSKAYAVIHFTRYPAWQTIAVHPIKIVASR
jgi:hypothetical protein